MFKLVATWTAPKPEDRAAFEEAYLGSHAPKARAVPGLASLETILIGEGLEGTAPAWHRVAIMTWSDRDAFERDEETAQWRTLREDAGEMVGRFGVTLSVSMAPEA